MSTPTADLPHPFLDREQRKIRNLFDSIAPRYDFLNHFLSLNIDKRWRRQAVAELRPEPAGCFLDACTGTGDFAYTLSSSLDVKAGARLYATDFSLPMMKAGQSKGLRPNHPRPLFIAGDTLRLPFPDRTFDGAVVGFGIRNVEDLDNGLRELRRVLRQGGRLVILEFTQMKNPLLRPVMDFYCQWWLPRLGNWLSRSQDRAYSYLNESMKRWPDGETLGGHMREVGFHGVRWKPLFPGNVAVHRGFR